MALNSRISTIWMIASRHKETNYRYTIRIKWCGIKGIFLILWLKVTLQFLAHKKMDDMKNVKIMHRFIRNIFLVCIKSLGKFFVHPHKQNRL